MVSTSTNKAFSSVIPLLKFLLLASLLLMMFSGGETRAKGKEMTIMDN